MKHLLFSLATTTTLLLLILLSTTANGDEDNTVYDVMGEPLIARQKYYIVPYNYAPLGGGFTWKKNDYSSGQCGEYYLIQYNDTTNFGEPTAFYPLHSRQSEITFAANLNIAFKASPPRNPSHCHATSNVWKVEGKKVVLGGQMRVRDPSNVFTIEDLKEGGYSIRFCPRYRRYGDCGGLGILTQNGERRLVVNGTSPLAVAFEPEPIFLKKYGNNFA